MNKYCAELLRSIKLFLNILKIFIKNAAIPLEFELIKAPFQPKKIP